MTQQKINLTEYQQILLALLKSALWETDPESDLFTNLSEEDWKAIFKLSSEQGVCAIAFDGMTRLPKELQTPTSIKLGWIAKVERVEKEYEKKISVATELNELFRMQNIPMLLFKGLSLARYYPVPRHREFGDLDFYLFGDQTVGDNILYEQGAVEKKKALHDKHTELAYKGILVENHKYFLNPKEYAHIKILEKYLMSKLPDKEEITSSGDNLLFASPDFNAAFLTGHSCIHYVDALVLRHLCDWAVFLKHNIDQISITDFRQIMIDTKFINMADAFTGITVRYLGLEKKYAIPYSCNVVLEDKIMADILNPMQKLQKDKLHIHNIITCKCKRLTYNIKKYKLIHGNYLYKYLLSLIIMKIRNPKSIPEVK